MVMFKRFRKTSVTLLLIVVAAFTLSITVSSCGASSRAGCYDVAKYQKKSRKTKGDVKAYNPSKYSQNSPLEKNWIINNKRKTLLGHK